MKKSIVLILLALGLIQMDCKAARYGENENAADSTVTESAHLTNHINQRLEEVIGYFEDQMICREKSFSDPLIEINEIFDFQYFSREFLKVYPSANNNLIIFKFVQACAQDMINSDEYSWENTEMFNLVEALDPVCRYYRYHSQHN